MKRKMIFSVLFLGIFAYAQNSPDRILGTWLNTKKNVKTEIFKNEGKYFGKVVWLAEPNKEDGTPKTDIMDPDSSLRLRKVIGLEIISNLQYKNGKWINGILYAVPRGKYLDCEIELSDNGKEFYITLSRGMIKRTKTWTRVDK